MGKGKGEEEKSRKEREQVGEGGCGRKGEVERKGSVWNPRRRRRSARRREGIGCVHGRAYKYMYVQRIM